jgi:hypothetical protein
VRIAARPERVWEALMRHDLAASPLSRLLLALRGYGARVLLARAATLPERLERFGFTTLGVVDGHEAVFGLAGKFWTPSGGLRRLADEYAFETFAEEGCVKAAWNLKIDAVFPDACELTTETRIAYFGEEARRKFRIYWALIRPFSALVRLGLLRGIRRAAERSVEL